MSGSKLDGLVTPATPQRRTGGQLYLIGPDRESPLAGGGLPPQQSVHQHKHLLHHCILTKIILALEGGGGGGGGGGGEIYGSV